MNSMEENRTYEVRKSSNGDTCIMLREYNVRIATFERGCEVDADNISKLLNHEGHGR